MSLWTPEPWLLDAHIPPSGRSVIARFGDESVSGSHIGPHPEADLDNAKRAVECVNACAGLRPSGVPAVVMALHRWVRDADYDEPIPGYIFQALGAVLARGDS